MYATTTHPPCLVAQEALGVRYYYSFSVLSGPRGSRCTLHIPSGNGVGVDCSLQSQRCRSLFTITKVKIALYIHKGIDRAYNYKGVDCADSHKRVDRSLQSKTRKLCWRLQRITNVAPTLERILL